MQLYSRLLRREPVLPLWVQSGEANSPSRMTQVLEERYMLCVVRRMVRVTCRVLYGNFSKRCRRAHPIQCFSVPFPVTVTVQRYQPFTADAVMLSRPLHCGAVTP